MMITLAMAYAVTTHEVSSIVAPRFPLISLKATFTMEISINSMMAAEMTVTTMIARVKPVGKFDDDGDDILLHFYIHFHTQASLQNVFVLGFIIQLNFHGYTLRDLYKIAGCIIWREKRELSSRCQTEG